MAVEKPNYTQTPNRFIDEYMSQVSSIATCVYLTICRKTIGYHKDTDEISLSQIVKLTGLTKNSVLKGTAELEAFSLITVSRKGKGRNASNTYGLNFDSVQKSEMPIDNSAQNEPLNENSEKNGAQNEPINPVNGAQNEPINPVNGAQNEHTKEINIKKEYKETNIEPVGSSAFHEIDKIFQAGSEKLTGQPYYKDGKEAKQIKLLEARYIQNPELFKTLVYKYYFMITEMQDDFWNSQPLTPSAFNSLYNRIQSYQLPEATRKREEQKQKSESDILLENYGNLNKSELQFLLGKNTISKDQFEIIMQSKPLEVSA